MNERLVYNGVVTLIQKFKDRVVSKRYHNSGENHLFEAYARALCGQTINSFIPKFIDVGVVSDGGEFQSVVKSGVTIPVLASYKSANTDGGNYGVPYCRVSVTMLSNMFDGVETDSELHLQLKSSHTNDNILATVMVNELSSAITSTTSGIQLILLWDLYITNENSEGD